MRVPHLVSLEPGQRVQDGLDGAQGGVTAALLPRVCREACEEVVEVPYDGVNVQVCDDVGQHTYSLPQALWGQVDIHGGEFSGHKESEHSLTFLHEVLNSLQPVCNE